MSSEKLLTHKTDSASTVGLELPPPYTTSDGLALYHKQQTSVERMIQQECLETLQKHQRECTKEAVKFKILVGIALLISFWLVIWVVL